MMKTAADVMTSKVLTVTPNMPAAKAAALILKHDITSLPVVDASGRLVGIVSGDDLVRAAEAKRDAGRAWWLTMLATPASELKDIFGEGERPVGDVMSRDVVVAAEDTPLQKLVVMLARRHIKQVPIVRDDRLVGIVSRIDILRYIARERTVLQFDGVSRRRWLARTAS